MPAGRVANLVGKVRTIVDEAPPATAPLDPNAVQALGDLTLRIGTDTTRACLTIPVKWAKKAIQITSL